MERRGPRVKPTILTAGDVAYAAKVAAARQLERELARYDAAFDELRELRAQLERERAAAAARPAPLRLDETLEEARAWIAAHGGSVTAALKQTHPDHGGSSGDFQRTMKARDLIRRARQRR